MMNNTNEILIRLDGLDGIEMLRTISKVSVICQVIFEGITILYVCCVKKYLYRYFHL